MVKKALYAGSFDPVTNGHLDIINRAAKQYDKLVIGVISNPSKKPFFSTGERRKMLMIAASHLSNVEVASFEGLLAEYVNKNNFDVVVRGLRATTDFEFEIQMAQMNARLFNNNVETIFLMTDPSHSFVSSNLIKEVHNLGGDIEGLVPEKILKIMNQKRGIVSE